MQFNRDEQGNMTSLPRPSIDTGAGLERLAAVLQGKNSNFDTDLFRPLIEEAAGLANVEYGSNHDTDVSLRIIADHARAATFLISDGVLPSNEGRGYVLRLIMRRALYHGQTLGLNEPFLYKMGGHVVQMMKDAYPELLETERHIAKAIKLEEERYAHTTRHGLEQLDRTLIGKNLTFGEWKSLWHTTGGQPNIILPTENGEITLSRLYGTGKVPGSIIPGAEVFELQVAYGLEPDFVEEVVKNYGLTIDRAGYEAEMRKWREAGTERPRIIPGAEVFKLHDTYGLRPDFIEDVVRNDGWTVGRAGYEAEMHKQRERARASWKGVEKKAASPVFLKLAEEHRTVFDGYTQTTSTDCRVVALVVGGRGGSRTAPTMPPVISVEAVGGGEQVEIVLDHTPFYAEAGGQVGDTGFLLAPASDHELAHVTSTYYPVSGLIAHRAVARDTLRVGDLVTAKVDVERRDAIRRNHSATHLLHAALRRTLGTHVKQAGSLVAPDRLRFDFTHYAGLDDQDLLDIEDLVNEHILKNEVVATEEKDLDSAVASGAMALFGEKYADKVRVLSIDDFSKELCGGTHVRRTGDIGLFKIISESSVAAGTRRIEAVTGEGVLKYLRQASETLALLADSLHAKPEELLQAVEKLSDSEKKLRKELEAQRQKGAEASLGEVVSRAGKVKGVFVIAQKIPEPIDRAALRNLADRCRAQIRSGVVVLGNVVDGKVSLIAAVTKDLTDKLDAGKIVKQAAAYVEGSGGGRKDLAEAGGKNPAKLDESLQAVPAIIEAML